VDYTNKPLPWNANVLGCLNSALGLGLQSDLLELAGGAVLISNPGAAGARTRIGRALEVTLFLGRAAIFR
jgi:hypothetical protein